MATRKEITGIILKMQYLPNCPVNESNIEIVVDTFEMVLSDLPIETVQAAAWQYLSTETFFPAPGKLREIAMDLQMLAMGIPTPAEAWGMVLTANKYQEKVLCVKGLELWNKCLKQDEKYFVNMREYDLHTENCMQCDSGGYREDYGHPAVKETVRLLGGSDVILTDNPTADRARFIEAYREVMAQERTKTAMLPEVRGYVQATQNRIPTDSNNRIKQLSERLTK